MSDDRDDRDEGEDEGATSAEGSEPDASEEKGALGLTEEFARIESEIEAEVGGTPGRETDEWAAPEAFGETGEDEQEVDPAGGEADPPEDDLGGEEADPPVDGADEEVDGADEEVDGADEEVDGAEDAGDGDPVAEDDDTPAPSPSDAPALEHTVVRQSPPPRPPASVGSGLGARLPPLPAAAVKAPKTPALWWRFLTGSVLIVAAIASAVSISFLLFLGDVAAQIQPIPKLGNIIDEIEPGEPQTILILGSDKRSDTPGDPGRSDTTMLLRVDAEQGVLSLFSLPRDLKVEIPGYGTGKLNEAYTAGGVQKTTKTVKELTGLEVNHVVNVDFQGFADAVDAIGCVYVDVDRDYFNDNAGLFGDQAYAAIDVNSGYQRLCGFNALEYVRYRHFDTDIVRAARQQDFLSQARRQVPASEVIPIFGGDLSSDLIDIFTKYTRSDIRNTEQVIGTLKSFIAVRNVPIQQVSFEGELGPSYVTATPEQIQKAVDEFLGGEDTEGPIGGDSATERPADRTKDEKRRKGSDDKEDDPTAGADVVSAEDASIACDEGVDKFAAFGRTSARRLKFPVYVPTAVVPGSCYSDGSRQYEIKDLVDDKQPAYKMVIEIVTPENVTEYYGVQGTTWNDPPILRDASETRTIEDREYELHYDGDRLKLVAWHDAEGNSYWVSNTLLGTLDENDMLAIAASLDEAHS